MHQPIMQKKLKSNGSMMTSRNNTKKDVVFIIGDWNAKVGNQESLGVTRIFGLGVRNETGQRLIEFCQENALIIANTFFQHPSSQSYSFSSSHVWM